MGELTSNQLGVIGALFLSVASSVSIVICNKALMSNLGFPFGNLHIPLLIKCLSKRFQEYALCIYQFQWHIDLSVHIFYMSVFYTEWRLTCDFWLKATTLTSWHLMVTYCTLHVANRLNFFDNKKIDMKTVILFGILNGVSIGFLNLSLGFNSIGFYQVCIPQWYKNYFSVLSTFNLWYFGVCFSDDQTCNYTVHCASRNSFLEKTIQVTFDHICLGENVRLTYPTFYWRHTLAIV